MGVPLTDFMTTPSWDRTQKSDQLRANRFSNKLVQISAARFPPSTGLVYSYEKYTTAGIGWEYDILHDWMDVYHTYTVYRHKGWGQIKIGRWSNKSGLNEQTSAVAAYFHKQGSTTGSLGFSPLPSIAIEGSLDYDKTDDKACDPFTWNHYKY